MNNESCSTFITSDGCYVPCEISGTGIVTAYVGKSFTYKKELDEYVVRSGLAYDGQLLISLYDGYYNEVSRYRPCLYMVQGTNGLKYYGHPYIDESSKDQVLNRKTPYIAGELYSYSYRQYFYNGTEWHHMSKIFNPEYIIRPEDIITVFDQLQERATELGYPIKLFTGDRPIHPLKSVDAKLSLVYDLNTPNAILAALNVKETVENIFYQKETKDND